jgi:uncharacterized alpha-E superfamily protein
MMLSRVAENLYWFGRYLERAENAARMVDVEYHSSIERGALVKGQSTWEALIAANGAEEAYEEARKAEPLLEPADFLVLSAANPNSIRSILAAARELARGLREHVSREIWEDVNTLHLLLSRRGRLREADLFDLCATVKRTIQSVYARFDNAALQTDGRDWFRCGIFVERADMTTRILDTKYHILLPSVEEVGGPIDRFQWTAILKSASAYEAFRKVRQGEITGGKVVELLVFREDFPRSLLFCIKALHRHYDNATAQTPRAQRVHAERRITLLELDLRSMEVDVLIGSGLHEFFDSFQDRLNEIDRDIHDYVFRATPAMIA